MASDRAAESSSAFELLDHRLQRWVHAAGWTTLHDAQEQAIPAIMTGDRDVLIGAPTAAGKTEAAFLPILTVIAAANEDDGRGDRGLDVVCVSPLKALINDQHRRIEELAGCVEVPVRRWHGDVAASTKRSLLADPAGVLIITPESLEAIFANRGEQTRGLFCGLRYAVIDEMHAFLATARGAQLQSLLDRVDRAAGRAVPRVGLSATLADMTAAAGFLRPTDPQNVVTVTAGGEARLLLQMRGYEHPPPDDDQPYGGQAEEAGIAGIAGHVFDTLRGSDNLVFANSRRAVELYADRLGRRCRAMRVPDEFFPHHGNLSAEMRHSVEARLKDASRPATAVCTSTLELGIDIGNVTSVAQIGCPPTVAALRQRLGRSGRRDAPSVLRVYVAEQALDERTGLLDRLRWRTTQTAAMVQLLLDRWLETPDDPGYNYSTLIQQTLSLIAQHGGAKPTELHRALCGPGPFRLVDGGRYAELLKAMAGHDLISQTDEGTLLPGLAGERHISHYDFFAAFASPDEWKVTAGGRSLGTIPISQAIYPGAFIIFAGRRWQITSIDTDARIADVAAAEGGQPPPSNTEPGAWIAHEVRQQMASLYRSDETPTWMNATARRLLDQGRRTYRRLRLEDTTVTTDGGDLLILPFTSDRITSTTAVALCRIGLNACPEGPAVRVVADLDEIAAGIDRLLADDPPAASDLAVHMENREIDKWDWVLPEPLACESAGERRLDPAAAWEVLRQARSDLTELHT